MEEKLVALLATEVRRLIVDAKERLAAEMIAQGFTPEDGWRVVEELRNTPDGTQWVFRPVHLRKDSPELKTTVEIDSSGRPI